MSNPILKSIEKALDHLDSSDPAEVHYAAGYATRLLEQIRDQIVEAEKEEAERKLFAADQLKVVLEKFRDRS